MWAAGSVTTIAALALRKEDFDNRNLCLNDSVFRCRADSGAARLEPAPIGKIENTVWLKTNPSAEARIMKMT